MLIIVVFYRLWTNAKLLMGRFAGVKQRTVMTIGNRWTMCGGIYCEKMDRNLYDIKMFLMKRNIFVKFIRELRTLRGITLEEFYILETRELFGGHWLAKAFFFRAAFHWGYTEDGVGFWDDVNREWLQKCAQEIVHEGDVINPLMSHNYNVNIRLEEGVINWEVPSHLQWRGGLYR